MIPPPDSLKRLLPLLIAAQLGAAQLSATAWAQESGKAPAPDARAQYLELCARCHGPEGAGDGTADLPRPARSFQQGGFSYGNTRAAIVRTITFGIPGTPMPAHLGAVSPEELDALADYVIALGPERREADEAETVWSVTDKALVARGYLPAIVKGGPIYPRGLLLGLTSGTSFEYRADDVRLLAVRQGGFVQRRDWNERGGAPLLPLGKPTLVCAEGRPAAAFTWIQNSRLGQRAEPLQAQLLQTWSLGSRAGLEYALKDSDGTILATVHEQPEALATPLGAGFLRRLQITAGAQDCELKFDTSWLVQDCGSPTAVMQFDSGPEVCRIANRPDADGLQHISFVHGPAALEYRGATLRLALSPHKSVQLILGRLSTLEASAEDLDRLRKEIQ